MSIRNGAPAARADPLGDVPHQDAPKRPVPARKPPAKPGGGAGLSPTKPLTLTPPKRSGSASSISSISSGLSSPASSAGGSPLVPARSKEVVERQQKMRAKQAATEGTVATTTEDGGLRRMSSFAPGAHHPTSAQNAPPPGDEMTHEERTQSIELYRSCIDRKYVQKELTWAREYEKPVITVYEGEQRRPGYFDFDLAMRRYKSKSVHNGNFSFLFDVSAVQYLRGTFHAEAMVNEILAKAETMTQTATAASSSSSPPATAVNPPGHWDFFLSHGQKDGGDQMNTLMHLLQGRDKTVWLDIAMVNKDEPAMEEGVRNSTVVIVFLTGDPTEQKKAAAAAAAAAGAATSAVVCGGSDVGGGGRGAVAAAGGGIEVRLQMLISQKESGHLTEEEFNKAKARLLAEKSPSSA